MNKVGILALLVSIMPATLLCMNQNKIIAPAYGQLQDIKSALNEIKRGKKSRNKFHLSISIPSETSLEDSIPSETPVQDSSKMDIAHAGLAQVQNQLHEISMQKKLLQILDDLELLIIAESPDDDDIYFYQDDLLKLHEKSHDSKKNMLLKKKI